MIKSCAFVMITDSITADAKKILSSNGDVNHHLFAIVHLISSTADVGHTEDALLGLGSRSTTIVTARRNTLESDVVRSGAIDNGFSASIEDQVCLRSTETFTPWEQLC